MSKNKKITIIIVGFVSLFAVIVFSGIGVFLYLLGVDFTPVEKEYPIETRQLPQKNPTFYTFNGNLNEVRTKIYSATDFPPDFDVPFPFKEYNESSDYERNLRFSICEAKDDICLTTNQKEFEEIFKNKENQNDIYLANDGTRMHSTTYYAGGKPLEFNMDFHIHLEAIEDKKTMVTIFPVNTGVFNGYGGRGLHGGRLDKRVPVEPTTVEEYQLLRYIGLVLGEKDMPNVIFPR